MVVRLNGTELHNDRDSMTQALAVRERLASAVRSGNLTNVGPLHLCFTVLTTPDQMASTTLTRCQPQRPPLSRHEVPQ